MMRALGLLVCQRRNLEFLLVGVLEGGPDGVSRSGQIGRVATGGLGAEVGCPEPRCFGVEGVSCFEGREFTFDISSQ